MGFPGWRELRFAPPVAQRRGDCRFASVEGMRSTGDMVSLLQEGLVIIFHLGILGFVAHQIISLIMSFLTSTTFHQVIKRMSIRVERGYWMMHYLRFFAKRLLNVSRWISPIFVMTLIYVIRIK